MQKLTSDAYWFNVAMRDDGIEIVLRRIKDNATKRFWLRGGHTREQMVNYMNSLTDAQCDGFFPKARK